jgi:hypothetical protein
MNLQLQDRLPPVTRTRPIFTPEKVTAAIDKIDELLPVKILLENVAALKSAL